MSIYHIRDLPPPGDVRVLSRERMRQLLSTISSDVEVASTEYVPAGDSPGRGYEWVPRSAAEDGSGLVLISGPALSLAVSPPFPVPAPGAIWPGPDFRPLHQLLTEPRTVAVVLLRLGAYAVGVIEDQELVASKTGTRYVHGRHRAGGQSQRRFERNREKWIRELFDQVCRTAHERFGPYQRRIDHLALGGDAQVLSRFMGRCEALSYLDDRWLPQRVPVHRPNMNALLEAREAIWSSRVYRAPQPEILSS